MLDANERVLYVSALFHDIGKALARKGVGKHQEISANVISSIKSLNNYCDANRVSQLILHHHDKLNDELLPFLKLGDSLAASSEREEDESSYKKYLVPIYLDVRVNEEKKSNYKVYFKPLVLDGNVTFSDVKDLFLNRDIPEREFKKILDNFSSYLDKIEKNEFSLLTSLMKFFSFIPAAYSGSREGKFYFVKPNVSIFAHSKMTAAFAMAAYKNKKRGNNIKEFTIISGDISGIQKFIMKVPRKFAAKLLRSKSIFLQLLNYFVAISICKKLNLPPSNLLYSSGGHFYILSYRINEKTFETLKENVYSIIKKYLGDTIFVALSKVNFREEDNKFYIDNDHNGMMFYEILKEVSARVNFEKTRRYKYFKDIFNNNPVLISYGESICNSCNNVTNSELCSFCNSLKDEFYRLIFNNEIVKFSFCDGSNDNKLTVFNLFEDLGVRLSKEGTYSLGLSNFNARDVVLFIPRTCYRESYDKMRDKTGKIAVFKCDINSLGKMIKNSRFSPSQLYTFSFLLEFFFGYLIDNIIYPYSRDKAKRNIRELDLIFSGGDDLLIVGRPLVVFEFYNTFLESFRNYFINEEITFASSIVIGSYKRKIAWQVSEAEELLEIAKENPSFTSSKEISNIPYKKSNLVIDAFRSSNEKPKSIHIPANFNEIKDFFKVIRFKLDYFSHSKVFYLINLAFDSLNKGSFKSPWMVHYLLREIKDVKLRSVTKEFLLGSNLEYLMLNLFFTHYKMKLEGK